MSLAIAAPEPSPKAKGKLRGVLQVLLQAPPAVKLCWFFLILVITLALFAPFITEFAPDKQDLRGRLLGPGSTGSSGGTHLLGTDQLGRDVFSRTLYGARVSLLFGFVGTLIGFTVGTVLGLISGYVGQRTDQAIMFVVDAQQALPFIIICLAVIALVGPGFSTLLVLIGLAGWDGYARYARAGMLSARESQYVEASRSIGASQLAIVFKHVLPNVMAPLIVVATINVTSIIVLEAALSFLGIGVQPPTASWGIMVAEGRQHMSTAWWLAVAPAVVMSVVTISISIVGDWLRDVTDPTVGTN